MKMDWQALQLVSDMKLHPGISVAPLGRCRPEAAGTLRAACLILLRLFWVGIWVPIAGCVISTKIAFRLN
jgi:hypothetical protein